MTKGIKIFDRINRINKIKRNFIKICKCFIIKAIWLKSNIILII